MRLCHKHLTRWVISLAQFYLFYACRQHPACISSSWSTQISFESAWSGDKHLFAVGNHHGGQRRGSGFVCAPVSRGENGSLSKHVPVAEMVVQAQHHPAPEQWGWGSRRVDRSGRGSGAHLESLQSSSKAWVAGPGLSPQICCPKLHIVQVTGWFQWGAKGTLVPSRILHLLHSALRLRQDSSPFSVLLGLAMHRRRTQGAGPWVGVHHCYPVYPCFPVC